MPRSHATSAARFPEVHVYAYGDGNEQDQGWGCSYRNIQTILGASGTEPPKLATMVEVQESNLKDFGYVGSFLPSRWIEPHQCGEYLRKYHDKITCEALLAPLGSSVRNCLRHTEPTVYAKPGNTKYSSLQQLSQHLCEHFGGENCLPAIADDGTYSYCILGADDSQVLVGDPHRWSGTQLVKPKWRTHKEFFGSITCWAILFVNNKK